MKLNALRGAHCGGREDVNCAAPQAKNPAKHDSFSVSNRLNEVFDFIGVFIYGIKYNKRSCMGFADTME